MKTNSSRVFSLLAGLVAFIGPATAARAEETEINQLLDRARAFIGGDAVLDAVKSLHYQGTVTAQDGKAHKIDIIVRRPLQQRVVETTDELRVITVLDNYDGWRRVEQVNRPESARVAMLSATDVRQLRANTWQNIYFYHNIDVVGGTIAIVGDAEIEGVACVHATFAHTGHATFNRFFEKATGRLVLTRTSEGAESRESGEFPVAGIRFPKQLTTKLADKTSTVVFDEIRVNEEIDEALFVRPMPRLNFDPKPTAVSAPAAAAPDAPAPTPPTPAPEAPSPMPATSPTP